MITPALYYFTSSALSIDLNVNTGSDGFQTSETCSVSVAAGAAVKIANLLTTRAGRNLNIGYDAQLGYRKFIFTGYNTVFGYALVGGNKVYRYTDAKIRAYIRLDASDNGTNGELIFLPYEVDYDGTILLEDGEELVQYPDIALATDEEGQLVTPYALANTDANNTSGLAFYYIHIGTINIPEAGIRSWLNVIQSGQLETAKGNNEDGTGVWAKMFHLSPSNIIEVLLPFDKLSFHNSGDTFIDRITNQHGDDASLVDADFGNFTEWIYQHTIATTRSVAAYIKAKIAELDDKYFRKDQPDTDPHLATFGDVHVEAGLSKGSGAVSSGSLEVDGGASVAGDTELNGDVTIGASASNEAVVNAVMQVLAQMKSRNYVDDSPIGKGGWNLLSADDNGNSYMVIDKLFVRLKAIFNELELRKISYAGGNIIFSHAGSGIVGVKPLYRNGAIYAYRCYCKKDDGTTATENWWKVDDQAKCQTFNIQEGVHQNVENTYYWRKVVAVGSERASLDGTTSEELYNYADLSLDDCDANSDIPKAGDSIIQMGNRTDTERQGFISLEVFGSDAPAIKVYKGVNGYNLNNKMPIVISPKNTSMRVQHYEIETDYGVFPAVKERGEWDLISNHRCYYFDRVQHNGSSWLCTYPQGSTPAYTTEEPSVNATYWKVDAQAGESAPSYTEEWYAWSNVQSVVNATTEPTPNGGWYQVIGGQGEYAYLWKKLIRYTWNSATRVYVAGTEQYFRMSGTNGTSISVKGSVATVADLPSTHADGDAYVVEADRHLYMWSAEGNQWLDIGEFKGEDGRTYYTHVAWATSVTTNPSTGEVTNVTGFTIAKTADDTTHLWMGVYVDENSAADPDDALLYTWSYTKGVDGASITKQNESKSYALSNSGTVTPSSWQSTKPSATTDMRWIWTRTVILWSDGSETTLYQAERDPNDGLPGQDIIVDGSTEMKYYVGTSNTTHPAEDSSDWKDLSQVTQEQGKYLWCKATTWYRKATSSSGSHDAGKTVTYDVNYIARDGAPGSAGRGVTDVTEYYKATASNTPLPTPSSDTGWSTDPNLSDLTDKWNEQHPYLWNYEKVAYSSAPLVERTTPQILAIWTKDGAAGKGIDSFQNYYKCTNSPTAPSRPQTDGTDGWSNTPVAPTDSLPYLWNYEKITWVNPSGTTYTDVQMIGHYGKDGVNGYNTATIYLYKRSADPITQISWSNTLTYTFSTKSLNSVPTGWSLNTIPSGTDPLYVVAATALSRTDTDTIASNEWSSPVMFVENGENGDNGLNSASVFLYQRAASAPSKPSGTLTYTFATGVLSGTLGNWSQTIPSTNGNPCWVIQATAVNSEATDTIAASEWSEQRKMVEDGKDGKSVQAQYSSNGTSWHDAFATGDEWMRTRTTGGSWSDAMKIVGENGEDGDYTDFTFGISQYLTTANVNTAPADISSWSDAPLATTDEKPYLWSKQVKHTFNNGTETTSTPKYIRLTGEQGESAISSISLASHDIYFARNNSGTTAPSSGWGTDTLAPTAENKYVWRKDVYTYDSQEYGRNIMRGTATPVIGASGVAKWSNGQIRISQPNNGSISVSDEDLPDVPGVTSAVIITETASGQVGFCQDAVPLKAKRITQSCWIKGDAGVSVALQPAWISNVGVGSKTVTCDGTWQRVECSGTVPEAKNWSIGYVYLNANQVGKTLKVAGMKVEYGDEATDWCIAPEDLNSEDVYVWAVYGENAVQLTLDNQHEDFLYSESNANQPIAPQNGATSQAHLFDGSVEKTSSVSEWRISDNNGSSWSTGSNSTATASISSGGLLTVTGLKAATAVIKVRAKYNNIYYYADFTANKTSQDRYELKTTPSSIAFNSDDSWTDKTISLSAERTDFQGGKSTPSISTTANSGNLRVFAAWVNPNGSLGTLSRLNATTKTIGSSDASTYMGIYFELRWYFNSSTADSGAATTYRVCDFETVEIAKTANGATGPTGKGIVLDLRRDNYTEAQWNSWCTIGNNGSWSKNTDYDPADLDFTTAIRVGDYFTISGTATDSGLLHASIHRCTSITSSTKIYGTCTSHVKSGENGTSPLVIDTDNDADQFGTDSTGATGSTAQNKTANVTIYYGSTAQSLTGLTATVYQASAPTTSIGTATTTGSSVSANVTIGTSVVGFITVSYSGTQGTVTLQIKKNVTINADFIVKITGTCSRGSKDINFTVQQVKSGAAGDTPIIYQLHPSEKAFAFGRTDMNELTPASIVSQIGVEKTEGNTSTIINTTVAGLTYSWGFDSEAAKQTGRAIGTSVTVAKADAEAHRTVWIQLYNNSVAGDKETLPITKDGRADKPFIVQRDDTYVLVRDNLWLAEGWSTNCAEGHTLEIEKIDGVDADFDHFSIGDTFIVTGYDRTDGTLHFATFLCTAVSAESITGICYNHWLSGDPGMTGYEPPFLYDKVTLYALSNSDTVAPVDTQQETVWGATRPSTTTEKRFVWQKDCYTYTESEKYRNLIKNTSGMEDFSVWNDSGGSSTKTYTTSNLPISAEKACVLTATSAKACQISVNGLTLKAQDVTLSLWIKASAASTNIRIYPCWKQDYEISSPYKNFTIGTDWTKIKHTVHVVDAGSGYSAALIRLLANQNGRSITVCGVKLEYANYSSKTDTNWDGTPTWSKAPEDYYKEDIRVIERAGEAGIDVSLQDPVAIFTQNVTTNVVSSEKPKTNIIVTKGGVPVALSEYTVAKPSAIPSDVNCNYTVTNNNSEKSVEITSIWTAETIEGVNYPEEQGYAPIRVTYQGQTYDLNFKFYCNAMGKFKRIVEGDVETSIANKTWYEYNPATGQYDKTTTLGEFIRSSSQNTSKLTETGNDTISAMSEVLQKVDNISLTVYENKEGIDLFTHTDDVVVGTSWTTIPTISNTTDCKTMCVSIPMEIEKKSADSTINFRIYTKNTGGGATIDTIVQSCTFNNGVLTSTGNKSRFDAITSYVRDSKEYVKGVLYFEKTQSSTFRMVDVGARNTGTTVSCTLFKSRKFSVGVSLKDGLIGTGIDISAGKIVNTADQWECQNNSGVKTAWLDAQGNLTVRGVYNNLLTEINFTSGQESNTDKIFKYNGNWYLDVLRCGDMIRIKSLPSDLDAGSSMALNLPYWFYNSGASRANSNRTYTKYRKDDGTDATRLITADEMRQLVGKRMVIILDYDNNTKNNNLYLSCQYFTPLTDTQAFKDIANGCVSATNIENRSVNMGHRRTLYVECRMVYNHQSYEYCYVWLCTASSTQSQDVPEQIDTDWT